jgi:callose synthase
VFRVVAAIFDKIEKSIQNLSLLTDFKMDHLPSLFSKFDRLTELLVITTLELSTTLLLLLWSSLQFCHCVLAYAWWF